MELLIVIAIIAVLVGAALPYVQGYVSDSKIAKAKADLSEIAGALARYETQEGPYNATDVSLLLGRHIQKIPVDPWGQKYRISTLSGEVHCAGPDRNFDTKEDNLVVSYLPPLALLKCQWLDANHSGIPDDDHPADVVILTFNRPIINDSASFTAPGALDSTFEISTGTMSDNFNVALTSVDSNRRAIRLVVRNRGVFNPAIDTIIVKSNQTILQDMDGKYALGSQPVRISSQ